MADNRSAFLDMLAWSEGTSTIAASENGYNVLVGSTPDKPLLFYSYTDHPRILNERLNSTAAGRYQLLEKFFDAYKAQLHLPDFSPASQDAIALQQIGECRALPDIDGGRLMVAVLKCRSRWASLPGSNYGQRENNMNDLIKAYLSAGGKLLSAS